MTRRISLMTPDEYDRWLFVDGKRRGETRRYYGN